MVFELVHICVFTVGGTFFFSASASNQPRVVHSKKITFHVKGVEVLEDISIILSNSKAKLC
jgi:hypothetical protein